MVSRLRRSANGKNANRDKASNKRMPNCKLCFCVASKPLRRGCVSTPRTIAPTAPNTISAANPARAATRK